MEYAGGIIKESILRDCLQMYGRIKQIQRSIVKSLGLATYRSHYPFSLKRQGKGGVSGIWRGSLYGEGSPTKLWHLEKG